jgi:hypothetical protein
VCVCVVRLLIWITSYLLLKGQIFLIIMDIFMLYIRKVSDKLRWKLWFVR